MKNIKITPPEGYEIDRDKSTFDEIVFKEIKVEYPTGLQIVSGDLLANSIKFARLVETSRVWNKIDGFENKCGIGKWGFGNINNMVDTVFTNKTNIPIGFKDRLTCRLFYDTFRAELEEVKELL